MQKEFIDIVWWVASVFTVTSLFSAILIVARPKKDVSDDL